MSLVCSEKREERRKIRKKSTAVKHNRCQKEKMCFTFFKKRIIRGLEQKSGWIRTEKTSSFHYDEIKGSAKQRL